MTTASHLLLDHRIIAAVTGARLLPGTVVKEPANPLFAEELPWEVRFDNLYANVAHDPVTGRYRCWYNPFIIDEVEKNTPAEQRLTQRYRPAAREMAVCYAESADGLLWEKPALGICEFEGAQENNILVRGPHGSGVFRDDRDPDPARRYKLFYARDDMMTEVAFSADGLRWSPPLPCPDVKAVGDTHNHALWVPELDRYVGITRLWSKGPYQGVRLVGRTESPDFIQWTRAEPVFVGLSDTLQIYAMPVFCCGDGYLGLPMIFDTVSDRVHSELAWSPDTVHWTRIAPGTSLIPNGYEGSWDWGCIYAAACPITHDDGILLYYGGSDNVHTNWRQSGLGLARLRPDRFAGFRADAAVVGELLTQPFACGGPDLRLNVEAPRGHVTVAALDDTGTVLAESAEFAGDSTALPVPWVRGSLNGHADRPLRLRFRLHNATLYAFTSADTPATTNGDIP